MSGLDNHISQTISTLNRLMACVPFGIAGAVIGHLLMEYSLSVMSMFGGRGLEVL